MPYDHSSVLVVVTVVTSFTYLSVDAVTMVTFVNIPILHFYCSEINDESTDVASGMGREDASSCHLQAQADVDW